MASDIQTYLKKVLNSGEFENSTKAQKLLEYLVNSTLKGKIPREATITAELYGTESKDHTQGESKVRVNVHNVRMKLDSYYRNEGKTDGIQFNIPKGRYKVEFISCSKPQATLNRRTIFIVGSVLALLILADLFFLRPNPTGNFWNTNRNLSRWIWNDFADQDIPLAVVIGDYFLLDDATIPGRARFIRDIRINSESDFDNFLLEYPEYQERLERTNHTVMGKYAPVCINDIGKLMYPLGKNFEVLLASEFQWQDLENYNVIYIGTFKSLSILDQLTRNSNFSFNQNPSVLLFHELERDSSFRYQSQASDLDDAFETDHCVVTKLPVSDHQDVLMFLSVRDIGVIAAMDYFTDAEHLKSFENLLKTEDLNTEYFEACFKVEGMDRHSMNLELLHLNRLQVSPSSVLDQGQAEGP